MDSYEIGKKYVALMKEGRREECLSTLFSPDAVSVEAAEFPGRERTVKGLDGLRAKSKSLALIRTTIVSPSASSWRSPSNRTGSDGQSTKDHP